MRAKFPTQMSLRCICICMIILVNNKDQMCMEQVKFPTKITLLSLVCENFFLKDLQNELFLVCWQHTTVLLHYLLQWFVVTGYSYAVFGLVNWSYSCACHEGIWGSRGVALVLNLGTLCGWVVSFMPWLLYLQRKRLITLLNIINQDDKHSLFWILLWFNVHCCRQTLSVTIQQKNV